MWNNFTENIEDQTTRKEDQSIASGESNQMLIDEDESDKNRMFFYVRINNFF